jgi:hypothetical protein
MYVTNLIPPGDVTTVPVVHACVVRQARQRSSRVSRRRRRPRRRRVAAPSPGVAA